MPQTDSPLRYPGGKSALYNLVEPIVSNNLPPDNRIYVEPFAGGAGLALHLLQQGKVDRLILNDIDYHIFCFWNECLYNADELCDRIQNCDITMDTWRDQHYIYENVTSYAQSEIAFATFFLNRCNISGIICGGPIGGADQAGTYGLDARFNRTSLISKIRAVAANSDRIAFYNMDAKRFLIETIPQYDINHTILNIDPPYVKKGPILYRNSFLEKDHRELAKEIIHLDYKWIVTYDDCDLINELYASYRREIITLNYSAGRAKKGKELLIYSDDVAL